MKPKRITGLLGRGLSYASATGLTMVDALVGNVLAAIDSFEERDMRTYRASFGDEREILSSSHGGFCLTGRYEGRISRETSYENVMCVGQIGSGKTATLALPSCMMIEGASMVVTDPSGQIRAKVSPYLRSKGVRVLSLRLDAPDSSHCFNPFNFIRTKSDAYKVAYILVSCILKVGNGDNFWFLQAQTMIFIFISIVMTQEPEVRHMSSVRHLLNRFSIKPESLDSLFCKYSSPELFEDWKALNMMEEKVLRSVIATAQSALGLWFDEGLARLTCTNDIDFALMREVPTALFIENPTANSKVYAPLLSMFFELAFKELMTKLPSSSDLDVFFILDEIGTLRFESLPDILNNNRKYRLPVMSLWQSQEIMVHQFGAAGADSIRDASRTKVFLSGMGLKGSHELEDLLGKEEYVDSSGSQKVRPLMLAQDIRLMQPDEAIILSGTMKPLRVDVTPYFRQRLLERKLNLPPWLHRNQLLLPSIPLITLP